MASALSNHVSEIAGKARWLWAPILTSFLRESWYRCETWVIGVRECWRQSVGMFLQVLRRRVVDGAKTGRLRRPFGPRRWDFFGVRGGGAAVVLGRRLPICAQECVNAGPCAFLDALGVGWRCGLEERVVQRGAHDQEAEVLGGEFGVVDVEHAALVTAAKPVGEGGHHPARGALVVLGGQIGEPLGLADEHIETEKMLADSGIVYTLLRNGWYSENYLASAPAALEHGVFIGAAGDGKIASATRADYAAAAARVISEAGHEGKVYELAGDSAWTLTQLAAELTKQSGKQVTYQNLSETDFAAALKSVGLPDGLADMLADSDVGASKGGLFDDSKTLSKLIGRPTTTLAESVSHLFNVNN